MLALSPKSFEMKKSTNVYTKLDNELIIIILFSYIINTNVKIIKFDLSIPVLFMAD